MIKLRCFIINLGYDERLPEEEARRITLLTKINFVAIGVLLFYLLLELYFAKYAFIPAILTTIFLSIVDTWFIYLGFYKLAKHFGILMIAASVSFFVLSFVEAFTEVSFIPLCATPLVIFKNKKTAYRYLALILLLIVFLKSIQSNFPPIMVFTETELQIARLINLASAAIITFFLTFYFRLSNEEFEKKLIHVNELVSEKNKEITDSIQYARHIQKGLLPDENTVKSLLPESFVFYQPKDIVAGDFYWVEKTNGSILIAAADCTGHGVPGAMVSVVCSNALNRTVKEFGITEPGKILDKATELVIETFSNSYNGSEIKDGMDISLIKITPSKKDTETFEIEFAGANNPLWLYRKLYESDLVTEDVIVANKTITGQQLNPKVACVISKAVEAQPEKINVGQFKGAENYYLEEIKGDKQPIGRSINPKPFTTHQLKITKGDFVFLFTDGFADQFGGNLTTNAAGKKFRYSQLRTLLQSVLNDSVVKQKEKVEKTFFSWKEGYEQTDDVTVIGIRV